MKKATLKWWHIALVLIAIALIGNHYGLFSVINYTDNFYVCHSTYGYEPYYFKTGDVMGYHLSEELLGGYYNCAVGLTVTYGDKEHYIISRRSTTGHPGCGSITYPNGTVGHYTYYSWELGSCPEGSPGSTLYFLNGEIVSNVSDAELIVERCTCAGNLGENCGGKCPLQLSIPVNLINMSIDPSRLTVFTGQEVKFPLYIQNDWGKYLKGTLYVDYRVETPFGNATKSVEIPDFEIGLGEKIVYVEIPTANVADRLYFRARFDTVYDEISGFVGTCSYGYEPITAVHLKEFDTDWQIVVINPKPLYLPVPLYGCDSLGGYQLNEDETFCIRDDIADLSCMQIGCPIIEGLENDYFCTSAGICAEMVYKYGCTSDADCEPYGAVCVQSSVVNESFCIKTEIKELISDVPPPQTIHNNCEEFDLCAAGYTCVDQMVDGVTFATCIPEGAEYAKLNYTTTTTTVTAALEKQWIKGVNITGLGLLIIGAGIAIFLYTQIQKKKTKK